jgi:protein-S-isoprenylcysteine O-methyltransferase Ste14
MIYIGIGALGFTVIHLFDLVSLKRIPFRVKPATRVAGCAILIFSLIKLCLQSNTPSIPVYLVWMGWFLFIVSVVMIMLLLFINLPLRKTYISTSVVDKLIKAGFYALVRHPMVYWTAPFFFSLVPISNSHDAHCCADIHHHGYIAGHHAGQIFLPQDVRILR